MTILEDLYYGNIQPWEKSIKKGSAYQKTDKQLSKYLDELMASLDQDQKTLCEKIADKICDLGDISEKERFMEGFCIGAQIMWEIVHFQSTNFS